MDDTPVDPLQAAVVRDLLAARPWITAVLDEVRTVGDVFAVACWIGAGAVRDLAWDTWYGPSGPRDPAMFDGAAVSDVDVVFFDRAAAQAPSSPDRAARGTGTGTIEQTIEDALHLRRPDVRWDVTDQARVHRWYERRFGVAVDPLVSVANGIATWTETATAVAVAGGVDDLRICAPFGLDDLLDGVWRHNPRRATRPCTVGGSSASAPPSAGRACVCRTDRTRCRDLRSPTTITATTTATGGRT